MTTLLIILGGVLCSAIAIYAVLYWLARRRRTPDWELACDDVPGVDDILPTLTGLTSGTVYHGNSVEVLTNGAIFEPMLRDIAAATDTVHFETFIWEAGELERRFADALIEACGRGVCVRVTVDGVGSMNRTSGIFDEMRNAGVQLHVFSPLRPSSLHRLNERTHRKLLIVDGATAYTMGHGVSDLWLGDAEDQDHYRDTGVRITGPSVHGLQSVFAAGWAAKTSELLCGDSVFPSLAQDGQVSMTVISSSAGEEYSSVELAFTLAIAAARREILIQNPYFAPDRNVVDLLCSAVSRNVNVTLMVPGRENDSNLLRAAARHLYPKLLDAGVRVLEYLPTLSHQKVMIVDGTFVRVGSTNLDCRSLELNAEAGVTIHDVAVANELRAQFQHDEKHCRQVTLDQISERSWPSRVRQASAYLFHGQL